MAQRHPRSGVGFGFALVLAALAPASPQQPVPTPPPATPAPAPVAAAARPADADTPASWARARAEAGAKTFDMAWLYYSEDRIDADKVYRWSRRLWEADRAAATTKDERAQASDAHLGRMLKLEAKITKIRRLGFGNSLDVLEAEYYRKEAEFWRAEAQAP